MRQRLNDALEVIKPIGWLVLGLGLGAAMVATFTAWRESRKATEAANAESAGLEAGVGQPKPAE